MEIVEEMDETVGMIVEDVVEDMEKIIEEQERERVLGQVNLRLAEMQLENMKADEKGERRAHALDNITRLNIFFKISGDQHCLSEAQKVRDEGRSDHIVEEELQNFEETGEEESVKERVEEDDVVEMLGLEVTVEMENVGETGEGEDEKGEKDSNRVLDEGLEGLALDADSFSQDTDKVFDKIVRDLDEMFLAKVGELEREVNKSGGCILFDV